MEKATIRIPYPQTKGERKNWSKRYSLNAIYSGKHPAVRAKDKEAWKWMVKSALNAQGINKRPFQGPVRITFYWHDGLDIDNHAYMGKMIVDALKGYLLTDDSPKYFSEVVHRFHKADCILVEVEEIHEQVKN